MKVTVITPKRFHPKQEKFVPRHARFLGKYNYVKKRVYYLLVSNIGLEFTAKEIAEAIHGNYHSLLTLIPRWYRGKYLSRSVIDGIYFYGSTPKMETWFTNAAPYIPAGSLDDIEIRKPYTDTIIPEPIPVEEPEQPVTEVKKELTVEQLAEVDFVCWLNGGRIYCYPVSSSEWNNYEGPFDYLPWHSIGVGSASVADRLAGSFRRGNYEEGIEAAIESNL